MIKKRILVIGLAFFTLTGVACGIDRQGETVDQILEDQIIRVASHIPYMVDTLNIAAKVAARDGWKIEIIEVSDNVQYNELLNNHEVDANFAQHEPFMEKFNEEREGNLVVVQKIYDAKVGFYSSHYETIDEIPKGTQVALPDDLSNLGRALAILAEQEIIQLTEGIGVNATIRDIINNSNEFEWLLVDLLTLSETYYEPCVSLMYNYPAYISKLDLKPSDAMFLEIKVDDRFAISLVAREDNQDSDKIKALVEAMTSPEVREFLEKEHSDTLIPSF